MDISPFFPPRAPDARKGDFGRVLVVGGSERYAGAAAFNALAALRAGADLAIVLAPRRAADIVAGYSPDLITVPCPGAFPQPSIAADLYARADALVVGGGVDRTPEAHRALLDIMIACGKPVVADAEALHALAGHRAALAGRGALITPHGGEFAVLSGQPWPAEEPARVEAARRLARATGATVLVKGHRDVVTDGERAHVDAEGSPFLTKGGYGDLVAGAAGALLARGASAFDAGRVAAFIVGRAGAIAAADLGESTLASDALARFPRALRGDERQHSKDATMS